MAEATKILAALALGLMLAPVAQADTPHEGDPGWSCVDDGNRICGPTNDEGKPAGCYDDGGVLVAPWPCHLVVNPDGSSDVWTGR
jgi:hypothetical protein